MGIFKRRGSKSRGVGEEKEGEEEGNAAAPITTTTTTTTTTTSRREQTRTSTRARRRRSKRRSRNTNNNADEEQHGADTTTTDLTNGSSSRSATPIQGPPTWEMVPRLISDLETAPNTHGEQPARALRMLFALSEQQQTSNRTNMVREQDGKLVMVLLDFLRRCERGSSEQYLSLLVLNNISIPAENKRIIALHCDGAQAFSRLLCEDPSCHLLAIILVNLTFCEADLRRELVSVQLLESLAYALKVSSLTLEEYETFQPLVVADADGNYSPRDLLQALMEEDARMALGDLDANADNNNKGVVEALPDPSTQLYPETARWCLSAIKNLTRPQAVVACNTLIDTGIVPLILKMVTVGGKDKAEEDQEDESSLNADRVQTQNRPPENHDVFINSPAKWDSNSMQDAALFVIMNLATAAPSSRDVIREANGVALLVRLADFWKRPRQQEEVHNTKVMQLQCLKARMALGCLLGSEGHFGQLVLRKNGGSVASVMASAQEEEEVVLVLQEEEANLLLQLLADAMHGRARGGAGGYSATTFHVKWILFSIRCLLTHVDNQVLFAKNGAVLNTLLMKVLAQYALSEQASSRLDAEAASHAAFSLYLQSNYGFQQQAFLPAIYDNGDHVAGTGSLASKILTSYIHMEGIPPAGRHAADQLLLRLHYLTFRGSTMDLIQDTLSSEDFDLEDSLMQTADSIVVEKRSHGARPRPDIFNRPILRSRVPKKKGGKRGSTTDAPWSEANSTSVACYPSALLATQALSFGSTKVRHLDAIDDVAIANNIANSANGEKTESYNYWWIWKDASDEVQKHLERQTSQESKASLNGKSKKQSNNSSFLLSSNGSMGDDGPLTIFGFTCGPCN